MSRSSYTASERRGLLAIGIIALLIIGSGVTLGLCGRNQDRVEEIPVVVEHPEMIDTVFSKGNAKKTSNESKSKSTSKRSGKQKEKKSYRRRSPLDEPV